MRAVSQNVRGFFMVVVEFDYEEFKGLLNLPKEKVVNGLTEIGAPAEVEEETGKICAELTPNRPDWYSMEGLARALRSYYKKENKKYLARESDYRVKVDGSVKGIRPYTACAVVKNLKFDDRRIRDIVLLQEKLLATLGRRVKRFGVGIYPLHAITFPVRYTTMKPEEIVYLPLNYPKEADAREILRVHPKGKEYGYIIEKYERYPVFVDSKNKIMALIPIVNSAETGKVDTKTREVFVEVTGIDKIGINQALNVIVCTLADMGGEIYKVAVEYEDGVEKTPCLDYVKMKFDVRNAEKILGVKIGKEKVKEFLKRMGYEYNGREVLVPPYRADVMGEIDIIEDIAIVYGYNNFEPTLPNFFTPGGVIRKYEPLHDIMRGMGFSEIATFTITDREKLEKIGWKADKKIINPAAEEYNVIRPTVLVSLLEVLGVNKTRGLPQKFYEIGIVYEKGETKKKLCFGVCDKKVGFEEVRGYLQTILKELGFAYRLEGRESGIFESPFSAAVFINNKESGVIGKVKQDILKEFGIEFPVFMCEINVD